MKILALDTSGLLCQVALLNNNLISELQQPSAMSQGKLILPLLERLLSDQQLTFNELNAIAYVAGPGSFTGLRIAASVVQALGFAFNLPIIPLSSLAVLAQTAYLARQWSAVLTVKDARMQQLYWGAYQLDAAGIMQAYLPDQLLKPDQAILPNNALWYGVGDGWGLYAETLEKHVGHGLQAIDMELMSSAQALLQLAQAKFAQNEMIEAAEAIPLYLSP